MARANLPIKIPRTKRIARWETAIVYRVSRYAFYGTLIANSDDQVQKRLYKSLADNYFVSILDAADELYKARMASEKTERDRRRRERMFEILSSHAP